MTISLPTTWVPSSTHIGQGIFCYLNTAVAKGDIPDRKKVEIISVGQVIRVSYLSIATFRLFQLESLPRPQKHLSRNTRDTKRHQDTMQQSQPSASPPSYTRQDETPAGQQASTPSTILQQEHQSQPPTQQPTQTTTTMTPKPFYNLTYQRPRPPSPTPSAQTTASEVSTTSTLLPSYAQSGAYKGFPSEAAYLAALSEWAEEKKYIQPSEEAQTLWGFYGGKSMADYTEGAGRARKGETRQSQTKEEGKGLGKLFRKFGKRDADGT